MKLMRVLVISPHPDDESIGCGGAICKHVAEGDVVQAIFLTSGEKGLPTYTSQKAIRMREQEAKKAAAILGLSKIEFWREPDSVFRVNKKMIKKLQAKLKEWQPHIIYVPHDREAHPDHQAAAQLIQQTLADSPLSFAKPAVLMYEVWTPLQQTDVVINISLFIKKKLKAIRAHKSQCNFIKYDEAALGLNRYRGEMHWWSKYDYAEVFRKFY